MLVFFSLVLALIFIFSYGVALRTWIYDVNTECVLSTTVSLDWNK